MGWDHGLTLPFLNPFTGTGGTDGGSRAGLGLRARVGEEAASRLDPAAAETTTTTMRDRGGGGGHAGGLGGPGGLLLSRRALQVYAFLFVNTLIFVMRSQWM